MWWDLFKFSTDFAPWLFSQAPNNWGGGSPTGYRTVAVGINVTPPHTHYTHNTLNCEKGLSWHSLRVTSENETSSDRSLKELGTDKI